MGGRATRRPARPAPVDIDLDSARAGRREALGKEPTVRFGGKIYTLPVELPLEVVLLHVGADSIDELAPVRLFGITETLLGTEQWQAFAGESPTVPDVRALVAGAFKIYGVTLGEAEGSLESSTDTGEPSPQTSSAITASTPGKPSTAASA